MTFRKISENYEINVDGIIRNARTGRIIKTYVTNGYIQVEYREGGKRIKKYLHRLLAEAFLDNEFNKEEVDHIDRDTLNNNLSNLRWVNRDENISNRLLSNYILEFINQKWRTKISKEIKYFHTLDDAYLYLKSKTVDLF